MASPFEIHKMLKVFPVRAYSNHFDYPPAVALSGICACLSNVCLGRWACRERQGRRPLPSRSLVGDMVENDMSKLCLLQKGYGQRTASKAKICMKNKPLVALKGGVGYFHPDSSLATIEVMLNASAPVFSCWREFRGACSTHRIPRDLGKVQNLKVSIFDKNSLEV